VIHIDAWEVQNVETGLFFTTQFIGREFPERMSGPCRYRPLWFADPFKGNGWQRRKDLERMLEASFEGKPDPDRLLWAIRMPSLMLYGYGHRGWEPTAQATFEDMVVRLVRCPACECCGANPWGRDRTRRPVTRVADGTWRCERHVGRNPCIAEGCGKTRAGKRPSSNNAICGFHWKMVRPRLKRIDRALWKRHKKLGGWTDRLTDIYWRNWERIIADVRAKISGNPAEIEIIAESGPPPAALLSELQRLGL
jgi:hypothetical protein